MCWKNYSSHFTYILNLNLLIPQVLNAEAAAGLDDSFIPQVSAGAKASLFKGGNPNPHSKLETAVIDVGEVKTGAWASAAGVGVDASVNLVDMKASVFDGKIGLSAKTGVGVKDDSVEVKAFGTGITLGRKVGISVLGTSFGIDFGRLF